MKRKTGQKIISIVLAVVLISLLFIPFYQSSIIKEKITGNPPGWTDDIRLTFNTTGADDGPNIAVYQNVVHIVHRNIWSGQNEIYYINSTNSGKSWNNRARLSVGDPFDSRNPDLSANGSIIHMIWDDNDAIAREIKYCNSTDGGITWSSLKTISIDDGEISEGAKIVSNDTNIHVVWVDQRHKAESVPWNTEIYYARSTDGGITWDDGLGAVGQDRRLTNALYGSGPNGIGVNGSNIHIVFSDDRDNPGTFKVYYKRSTDNGATWDDGLGGIDQDREITTNGTNHGPGTIAVNGSVIHIAWIDEVWPGPNYYIYYMNSTDNGFSWSSIKQLTGPSPGIAYIDMAVWEDNVHVVWSDSRNGVSGEIYYINSTDSGVTWVTELQLTSDDGNNSNMPKISLNESKIHIVWVDQRDSNPEIYYKRSPDFPPDTSPPTHSNELPQPDSYRDAPGTNISVHVTDPSGVNDTTIQLWVNGSLVSHNWTPILGGYNVSYVSPGFEPGVVTCRIVADDNCSNTLDYTWNFTVLALYDIQLHEGWNLISVPHVQVDTAINEVLRDIDGKWNYIQWYDASDPTDKWKTNATFKPQQLNDLFCLNRTMAFWINITEPDVNLTVRGHLTTITEIPLYAGWNLVGFPTLNTDTVANSLWGTGADRVEVYNASAPYRIKEVGATYLMKPGEGYWVHVPANSVWKIDW